MGFAMQTVKIFTLGKAQAVRIPVRYRFDADEVEVFKRGDELVLRPKAETAADLFARARAVAGDAFKDFELPADLPPRPVPPLNL